jgi:hydrogenase maturation protease
MGKMAHYPEGTRMPSSSVLVIGIGNEQRGDDGAGLWVARLVAERCLPGVTVREESGEITALWTAWTGAAAVFLVDAAVSGARPGTCHCFDAAAGPLPASFMSASTHGLGVVAAVELARTLGRLPPRLAVYGIEGERFAAGTGLSAAVARAIPKVVASLVRDIGLSGVWEQIGGAVA